MHFSADAFAYFLDHLNPANGLIADSTREGSPCSIAAVGFALAAYPIGVERRLISRAEVVERTLAVLRFFATSPQGTETNATGYKGFYYHFLDMHTGRHSAATGRRIANFRLPGRGRSGRTRNPAASSRPLPADGLAVGAE
jgi:hypothetical protein